MESMSKASSEVSVDVRKEIKPFQSTFRINITADRPNGASRDFRPRKAHTKSRGGCQSCKQKRVRCDGERLDDYSLGCIALTYPNRGEAHLREMCKDQA